MNGLWLALPFLAVRFLLPFALDREALRRAARFAPMRGGEKIAYAVYQAATLAIFICLGFLTVRWDGAWTCLAGSVCYAAGLGLCAAAMVAFCAPDGRGLNTNGVYRLSRHPMYVGYFVCFVGMALLVRSPVLLSVVLIFQVAAHWMVLAEERWCLETFGNGYARYMRDVRRYL